MDEKDKRIEELEAQLKKIEDEKKEEEKQRYILGKISDFMFLIAGNLIYFGAIGLMKYIVDSWWASGILGDDPIYYTTIIGVWMILWIQGAYRLVMNLFELFAKEIAEFGCRVNKWFEETRKAREFYFKEKKQE